MKLNRNKVIISQSFRSGILFGIVITILSIFGNTISESLFMGVGGGLFFGLFIYLFSKSKVIKSQVQIEEDYLVSGEIIIESQPASLIIEPKKFGLRKFAFDDLLWLIGMKNKETIGGEFYLTNFRVIFKSHRLNRVKGTISIFLSSIIDVKNSSNKLVKKIKLTTENCEVEVILNRINYWKEIIIANSRQVDSNVNAELVDLVIKFPDKFTDGLREDKTINKINNILLIGRSVEVGAKLVLNPIGGIGSIFINEFLRKKMSPEKIEKLLGESN